MTPEELAVLVRLHHGDCLDVMRAMPDASVDSIVTDPPYGLGFMGKAWDALPPGREWADECLRVLKPGGHLLAFGGTRTWHRLAVAVEDAGFELRDSIAWLYGSGFPKSLDVAKAIDKAAGSSGSRGPMKRGGERLARLEDGKRDGQGTWGDESGRNAYTYVADTDDAKRWAGWGTALKPAFEPVVVGRKALQGTVAANVLQFGTGALNIDASRVGFTSAEDEAESKNKNRHADFGTEPGGNAVYGDYSMVAAKNYDPPGRWPANVILDASQAEQIGEAARFFPTFRYQAKAPAKERPKADGVSHPTVKPLDLMRWLVRLATPPGGIVLDPFLGSGTTAEACALEGFRCIGIEREAPYLHLTVVRLSKHLAAPTERTA